MNLDYIRQELSHANGRFPFAALRASVAQRPAVTPMLLDALREVLANPRLAEDDSAYFHTCSPCIRSRSFASRRPIRCWCTCSRSRAKSHSTSREMW